MVCPEKEMIESITYHVESIIWGWLEDRRLLVLALQLTELSPGSNLKSSGGACWSWMRNITPGRHTSGVKSKLFCGVRIEKAVRSFPNAMNSKIPGIRGVNTQFPWA